VLNNGILSKMLIHGMFMTRQTNVFRARKRATTTEERALMQNLGIATQIDSIDMYDPSKIKSYDWLNNVGLQHRHYRIITAFL
jgi:hypothetical protein